MSEIEGNPILKYTQGVLSLEDLATEDIGSVVRIQKFINENPNVINSNLESSTSIKNLFGNLEALLQKQPFLKSDVEKIKDVVEMILTKNCNSPRTMDKYKDLSFSHLKELVSRTIEKLSEGQVLNWLDPKNIQQIKDQRVRVEVIKCLTVMGSVKVSLNIKEYDIIDQSERVEIAKLVAAQNGLLVSYFIKNYGITNQADLVEIAKIAASQEGRYVFACINNYNIKDRAALIEIAKIAESQDREEISAYIRKRDIADQEILVAVLKIAAAQNVKEVFEYIEKYNCIKDRSALIDIAKIAIFNDPMMTLWHLSTFRFSLDDIDVSDGIDDSDCIYDNEYKKLLFIELAYLLPYMNDDCFKQFDGFCELAPLIEEGSSLVEKELILQSKTPLGLFKEYLKESEKTFSKKLQQNSPIEQAFKYRNKQIAYSLIATFIEEASDISYREAYLALAGETVTPRLPSILPAKWMKESGITEAPEGLLKFFKESKWALKNKDTGLMQMYLLAALSLDRLQYLLPERKLELLSIMCSQTAAEDILKSLNYLYCFSSRKEESVLHALIFEAPEDINEVLSKAFEGMLSKDPFVDMSNVSDIRGFIDFYLELFGHMRIPLALEVYKAKIVTLNDERMKTEVKRFISSVLLKIFDEERFRTDINPHLAKIESNDSSVFNAWKTLEFSAPVSAISTGVEQTSFSFRGFFETKLHDGHWGKGEEDKLPHLTAYLKGWIIEDPNDPVLQNCRELIENEDLLKEEQIKEIQKILSLLKDPKLRDLEFENDLEGLIRELNSKDQIRTNEEAVLSKDWQDLFLSGTEVTGSCQRVDGDPRATKCLLAYCMDGKNAMVAVKDKEGNKTLARSMLRLLWNENEQKPALFLDRLYPDPCLAERKQAIVEAATACAKQLNCDLFTKWEGYAEVPNTIVRSLGSSSPYEYTDAAEGVMANGIFQIDNLKKVYPSTSMP